MAWKGETIIIIQRKRKSKKGVITFAVTSLSAIAIVATGFSAWVISQTDSKTVTGTVTVDTVDNRIYVIEDLKINDVSGNTASIIFGKDKDTTTLDWLNISDVQSAKMSFKVTFTVTNYYLSNGNTNTDCNVSAAFTDNATYAAAVTNDYVGALPTFDTSSPTKNTTTATSADFTLNVQFSWGSKFSAGDAYGPVAYAEYKQTTGSDYWTAANKQSFAEDLQGLYSLNGVALTLTIATSSTSATGS